MSKIQDALRRSQMDRQRPGGSLRKYPGTSNSVVPPTAVPVERKNKIELSTDKHEIDQEELIHRGLLAPMRQSVALADQFRRIRRPLIDNAVKPGSQGEHCANIIIVTSAMPGAGKTFCSVNLAASISLERELNVLLVDADVTRPHISTAFGLADQPGLIDILEDETLSTESVSVRTNLNDIQVLPAGRKHRQSTELLASKRMEEVMHELAVGYPNRLIVMDSPSLLIASEAQAAIRQVGQVALVVESGKTLVREIQESLELLDRTRPINVILNKSPYRKAGSYPGGAYASYGFNEK